jgi:elongation factor G
MDGVENTEKFAENLKSIEEKLYTVPLVAQFPIGAGRELEGVIDVVGQKAYYFQMGDEDENYQEKEIPPYLVERTKKYRQELLEKIEKIIERDEELSLKYLEGQELSTEEVKKLLRQATLTGKYFPVFCGSAYKHVGVNLVLDGVVDYLPSPLDIPPIPVFSLSEKNEPEEEQKNVVIIKEEITELEKSLNNLNLSLSNQTIETRTDQALQVVKFEMEEKLIELKKQLKKAEKNQVTCNSPLPCLALAFKIIFDDYNRRVTFVRVYAGKISARSRVYNVNQKIEETVSSLVRMHADSKEEINEVGAGDIAAIIGLKYTITGDTFGEEEKPLLLENISFADPVISQAIEPKTNKDQDKLRYALERLKIQDPSFRH